MRNSSTTRDTLLSAAAAEIIQNGYAGASMAAIAARLDMTKGAFAYHFPAKSDLAVALSQRLFDALLRTEARVSANVPTGGLRALVAYVLEVGRECMNTENAAGVVLALDSHLKELDLPRAVPLLEGHVRARLEQAVAAGEVEIEPNIDTAVRYVTLQVIGSFIYLHLQPEHQTPDLHFLRMLVTALGGHDARGVIDDVLQAQEAGLVAPTPVFGIEE